METGMASNGNNGKVVVNLATGMEDAERVTVALLVSTAALEKGKQVAIWLSKDADLLQRPRPRRVQPRRQRQDRRSLAAPRLDRRRCDSVQLLMAGEDT
jgi:predicted peroxiredoxin